MTTTRITTPQTALSRELHEFLLELALAVQRQAIYPGGHPSVDAAVAALAARVEGLLRVREAVSVGVARRQLVAEGVATDASHPVLRSLAERLHRHRLGALSLRRGLAAAELQGALQAVALAADRGEPLGTWPAERLAQWPHVGFYRVTYEQLHLTAPEEGGGAPDGGGAAAQLWVGLAQAAVARSDGAPASVGGDPDAGEVARAINGHPAAAAYDQALFGYLLQLAEELRRGGGGEAEVRLRVSQLIRELDPATLQRLLAMAGDAAQRARFLYDATDALEPDAVLELVRAAAATQGENISTSMLRLLTKLSSTSAAAVAGTDRAGSAMRDQVRSLLEGWSLADPNPGAYTRALDALSRTSMGEEVDAVASHAPEPPRVVEMGLEVGAAGTSFWRAVDALVGAGQLAELFALLDASGDDPLAAAIWRRLESTDHVRRVLTTDPVDFESLDRILERLPSGTVVSLLLDRLSESASRATRMGVFRRLSARGLSALPLVLERLRDERWFVQRNMLALLNEIDAWPAGFSALPWARHEQPSVRREALQLAVRIPSERAAAILLALSDADERAVRIGVNAAREHDLPADGVRLLLQRIDEPGLSSELRMAFIRMAGRYPTGPVIDRLLAFVVHERRLLGPRLLPRSGEQLSAVSALAGMHTTDARVEAALALAAAAADGDVAAAATRRTP